MLILALDTALQRCSVAITRNGEVLASIVEDRERGHAERLAPMVAEAITQSGVAPEALTRIGVVIGPGGFTGIRVALAFARSMGLALRAEVVGVSSLAALSRNIDAPRRKVAPIIDARRGQVYAGLYCDDAVLVPPFVATPAEARTRLLEATNGDVFALIGSGVELIANIPGGEAVLDVDSQIDPRAVAALAAIAAPPMGAPSPLYLRQPDAKPSVQ